MLHLALRPRGGRQILVNTAPRLREGVLSFAKAPTTGATILSTTLAGTVTTPGVGEEPSLHPARHLREGMQRYS